MKKLLLTISTFTISLCSFSQTTLLGSYPFSGNANDVSGNGNNGTVTGATLTADRFGNMNSAYQFDGISSYIDIGNSFSYNSHSFSCWARKDSTGNNVLISKINNGPYDLQNSEFSINSFALGNGTSWNTVYPTSATFDPAQWNCYVGTYNATTGTAKIYVNGTLDTMLVGSYSDVLNTPIYIGARPYWSGVSGTTFFFRGAIDEVNIYSGVLTQQQVDSLCPSMSIGITTYATNEFNISPNPFTSQTTISFNTVQKNTTIRITDLLGKEIKTINFTGRQLVIDKAEMKEGIYFIQTSDQQKHINYTKIVIQ